MSLAVYSKKRDFRKTPEPRSGKSERKKTLAFVVQRHDATRLHYDFRLEMDGVLKSWAVPKGPSMIAGEKRLAMMVEDHPFPYRKFYGEIPEGNYGAGTVEIWDKGTYKPMTGYGDQEKDLLNMLEKGDLKIFLKGTYLHGNFALVRMKNSEKGNEWLLIKKKDEYASDSFDIESIAPLKSKARTQTLKAKQEAVAHARSTNKPESSLFEKDEKEKTLVFSKKKVKCTNLTKIYWPGEGYTKGDLISYYHSISKFILPYLKDRPQSLNRHPDGITGSKLLP